MAVTVETLEKLERKITLSLPLTTIQTEVDSRLKRMARTVKMDGFRPGKVPMNVVTQRVLGPHGRGHHGRPHRGHGADAAGFACDVRGLVPRQKART